MAGPRDGNFRIFHCDLTLARQAAEIAESVRTAQAKRWNSPAATATWTPRCDLYLHPNSRNYAEATGQPEVSPGVSTLANNGTRVVSRRMNLRTNNPLMLTATLPHEVTHIVMADVFIVRQIPRWADEGIAVLAEPIAEQRNRVADLQEPLESGRVFPVGQLMKMDYPDEKDWRLFYAQSVSLTRYLVDQGPPSDSSSSCATRSASAPRPHSGRLPDRRTGRAPQPMASPRAEAARRGHGLEPRCQFAGADNHAMIGRRPGLGLRSALRPEGPPEQSPG